LGGFVSPTPVACAVGILRPSGPWTPWTIPSLADFELYLPLVLALSAVGAIAGIVCARLFHKHGDKPSLFDVNAALDSVRAPAEKAP
jgi:hypothetical protein